MNPRIATAVRLAALALISWSVIGARPAPGTAGRGLVITVSLGVCAAGYLVWTARALARGPAVVRWPLTAEVFVVALAGGVLTGAAPASAASAFVFVAVVAAGLRADVRSAAPVLVAGAVALALAEIAYGDSALGGLAYTLGFAATLLAASNTRGNVLRAEQAELLLAQAQRSHEEQLRSARLEESTRIAREIHDVLAHSLASLVIQLEATAAQLEQGADRDAVLARVRRAHELARDGLRETRRAVGALRGERDGPGGPGESLSASIEALVASHRETSATSVELAIAGRPQDLEPELAEAVLRVVQEALTNVRKHAPGAAVSVRLDAGAGAGEPVVLTVADSGPHGVGSPLAGSGGGFGVRGMRERATALGGTLAAGPADGGWRVELRLPGRVRELAARGAGE